MGTTKKINRFTLGGTERRETAGQPPKYETPEELEAKISEYFESLWEVVEVQKTKDGPQEIYQERPASIVELALFLGFVSRQSFYDYEKNPKFSYIIKRARAAVESSYEKRLAYQSPTGAIFALKNMGWKDKVEIEDKTPKEIKIRHLPPNPEFRLGIDEDLKGGEDEKDAGIN